MTLDCSCRFIFFLFLFAFRAINSPTNAQIVVVDVQNALPNGTQTAALIIRCGQSASNNLKVGDHYVDKESVKLGIDTLQCVAMWGLLFNSWNGYEVKRDKGRNYIYWMVKKDGFYVSWDKSNWKKNSEWQTE